MNTKKEILNTLLPCPFCGNPAQITMGAGRDKWDGSLKAEYPEYTIRCNGSTGTNDQNATPCPIQPSTNHMHWSVEAAKEEWNQRSSTALIIDTISLLHALCNDRGVILHATCVPNPRTALHDLLIKHNLLIDNPDQIQWTNGNVQVTVRKIENELN